MNRKANFPLHTMVCEKCGRTIHFVEMKGDGRMMPCDTTLHKIITRNGNLVRGYRSHFSTCPRASKFKK
jgi:hypothetical protein